MSAHTEGIYLDHNVTTPLDPAAIDTMEQVERAAERIIARVQGMREATKC